MLDINKLKEALGDKASEFDFEGVKIMTNSEFDGLVDGYKAEIETTKEKSQKIGQEILLKSLKEDIGLDYEGRKDPENLKKAFIEKFGKPESTNEDVETLRATYAKQLQEKELEIESVKGSFQKQADDRVIRESLMKSFDGFKDKTHYKADDLVALALNSNEFKVVDGKVFQAKGGEVIKNDLLQGTTTDVFANSMMSDRGYIKEVTGGKIEGDKLKGGKYTIEQFYASQEAQGLNTNSEEVQSNLSAAITAGKIEL